MASKYYKLSVDAKSGKNIVTIDAGIVPTQAEKDVVQMYVNAGAMIRFKSEKRAAAARKRIKENGGKIGKKKESAENAEETKAE